MLVFAFLDVNLFLAEAQRSDWLVLQDWNTLSVFGLPDSS